MSDYADLEITFRRRDERSYALHFRFNTPKDEAEKISDPDPVITADFSTLSDDDPDYGQKLTALVFTTDVTTWFAQLRAIALSSDCTLRVRLSIDSSAPELHSVHWETLLDPAVKDRVVPLFMGERLLASRFLSSGQDWRPVRLRPKATLKALVVVANAPPRFDKLGKIDIAAELQLARDAMAGIEVSQLASGDAVPPTLNNLASRLKEGFDILYFVCHGQLMESEQEPYLLEPYIFLDGADDARPTPGQDLVQVIDGLDHRPSLIVMASCQSASRGQSGLAALGPRLAGVGVPAVIAMQGNVYMNTAANFMKTFFAELCRDGQIDRAVSAARAAVYLLNLVDYWKPVLFMRLRNGRIWYVPGFEGDKPEFDYWESICETVNEGECIPIIGPDVAELLLGTTHNLALELAKSSKLPLDGPENLDLAKMAQYISMQQSRGDVQNKLAKLIDAELQRVGERILQRPLADEPNLRASIAQELSGDPAPNTQPEPLKILAGLKANVFIDASGDPLIEEFLRSAKVNGKSKEPVILTSEWRDETQAESEFRGDSTEAAPFLYYMFGKIGRKSSNWVLTEDDFYDYLIQTSTYKLMPPVIRTALLTNRLLFLGFPIDDLKFRVMFRLIVAQGGRKLLEGYSHVGVQVDPSETTLANAQHAKRYLERYFHGSKIDIYWGSSTDFLRELKVQLDNAAAAGNK